MYCCGIVCGIFGAFCHAVNQNKSSEDHETHVIGIHVLLLPRVHKNSGCYTFTRNSNLKLICGKVFEHNFSSRDSLYCNASLLVNSKHCTNSYVFITILASTHSPKIQILTYDMRESFGMYGKSCMERNVFCVPIHSHSDEHCGLPCSHLLIKVFKH